MDNVEIIQSTKFVYQVGPFLVQVGPLLMQSGPLLVQPGQLLIWGLRSCFKYCRPTHCTDKKEYVGDKQSQERTVGSKFRCLAENRYKVSQKTTLNMFFNPSLTWIKMAHNQCKWILWKFDDYKVTPQDEPSEFFSSIKIP